MLCFHVSFICTVNETHIYVETEASGHHFLFSKSKAELDLVSIWKGEHCKILQL